MIEEGMIFVKTKQNKVTVFTKEPVRNHRAITDKVRPVKGKVGIKFSNSRLTVPICVDRIMLGSKKYHRTSF